MIQINATTSLTHTEGLWYLKTWAAAAAIVRRTDLKGGGEQVRDKVPWQQLNRSCGLPWWWTDYTELSECRAESVWRWQRVNELTEPTVLFQVKAAYVPKNTEGAEIMSLRCSISTRHFIIIGHSTHVNTDWSLKYLLTCVSCPVFLLSGIYLNNCNIAIFSLEINVFSVCFVASCISIRVNFNDCYIASCACPGMYTRCRLCLSYI